MNTKIDLIFVDTRISQKTEFAELSSLDQQLGGVSHHPATRGLVHVHVICQPKSTDAHAENKWIF